jgi:hypothetical protein
MVAFGSNQRNNTLQLSNSVCLVACGVLEQVHAYWHWISLASLRKTSQKALESLGRHAKKVIVQKVESASILRPLLCIDNLDFEETIHTKSLEKASHMFHGTWGYLHKINPKLLKKFDPSNVVVIQ